MSEQFLLVVTLAGQLLFQGHEGYPLFDTRGDCSHAANIAINVSVVGRIADADAYCYEWKDGKRGDFVSGLSIGCITGYAPISKDGCAPAAP